MNQLTCSILTEPTFMNLPYTQYAHVLASEHFQRKASWCLIRLEFQDPRYYLELAYE